MTLPEIVLPKIVLPFDIPVLLHPIAVHFLIALPIVVLLLELTNLLMKKKAVGGVSFFLLLFIVIAAGIAYLTGLTDGKAAYETLSEAAKSDLSEHKLLGTYILLLSGVVLFLKFLAMTGNKALKALYILVLIIFVVALFKQGEEGGELVYEHGLNVEKVKVLDDQIFDLNDELEDAKDEAKKVTSVEVPVKTSETTSATAEKTPEVKEVTDTPAPASPLESTGIETISAPAEETAAQNVAPTEAKAIVIPSENEIPAL